jgi:hypothetical protein
MRTELTSAVTKVALGLTLVVSVWSPWALAHHSFAKFDRDRVVELEGEITEVFWRNPHVLFSLRGSLEGQSEQVWHLETNSPGILRRVGISEGMVRVGDRVLVAGNPTVNGAPEINALNLLLPNDSELVLGTGSARFDGRQVGDFSAWTVREGDKSRPDLGLFRIWSTSFGAGAGGLFNRPAVDYPLTETAREAVETFDEVASSERLANDCTPKGMPWIMEQPYDVMFERDEDDILFKLEEFDVVRRIHMNFTGDRASQPYSIHGFSTGEWDGDTLVVETTNLNSPNFRFEIPATDQATLLERFTPTPDGDALDYTIVVTDLGTFTEPVTLSRHWLWLPDQVFDAYNCGQPLNR